MSRGRPRVQIGMSSRSSGYWMVTGGLTRWLIVVSMPLATPRPNAIVSLRSLADSRREPDDWPQQTAQAGEQRRQTDKDKRDRQHALPRKLHELIVTEA